jgi:hypothetical protein
MRRLILLLLIVLLPVFGQGCPMANPDSDGDGYTDEEERESFPGSDPNDPTDTQANPRDTDGDGCSDYDETEFGFCNADPNSSEGVPDADGDGVPDDVEIFSTPGSDPDDPTDTQPNPRDTDGDGCSDYDEVEFGFCNGDPNV